MPELTLPSRPPITESELYQMATMVLTLPRYEFDCEALAVYCGMGEAERIVEAIRVWHSHRSCSRVLLIAEQYHENLPYTHLSAQMLMKDPFCLKRLEGVTFTLSTPNTFEQAKWVIDQVMKKKISSLAVFTSPFHVLRVFCTTVKCLMDSRYGFIPIIPVPVPVSPNKITETDLDAWQLARQEMERICSYQAKGDVATFAETAFYLKWLWESAGFL